MSDTTETPTPKAEATSETRASEARDDSIPGSQQAAERSEAAGRDASKEAERYRRRLRETERERDALRERVHAFEREGVERVAEAHGLAVPGDLWTLGVSLDELRDPEGIIDPERAAERVSALLAERPRLARERPSPGDLGAGVRGPGPERPVGFADRVASRRS